HDRFPQTEIRGRVSYCDFATRFRESEESPTRMPDQLEPRFHQTGAKNMRSLKSWGRFPTCPASFSWRSDSGSPALWGGPPGPRPAPWPAFWASVMALTMALALRAADAPQAPATQWIESIGGEVIRDPTGAIVEVSLARTWATDNDIERIAQIKSLKRLDLSFTNVTDRGIEHLQQLQQLEELTLDTAEFITDAAMSYLRANRRLRKLVLRGTDITDVGLPYIASLTALKSLDLSYTMLG